MGAAEICCSYDDRALHACYGSKTNETASKLYGTPFGERFYYVGAMPVPPRTGFSFFGLFGVSFALWALGTYYVLASTCWHIL